MTTGPYLYDDDPAPLHTGTPHRRRGLLVGVFGGTAAVAVLLVVAMPLVKGSPEEQVEEVAGVFLAALEQGDTDTAHQLLCEDERARLRAGEVRAEYMRSDSGSVTGSAAAEVAGAPVYEVRVRWSGGGTTDLVVVNEDGPHICGVTPGD
jgi:hypothetical protein